MGFGWFDFLPVLDITQTQTNRLKMIEDLERLNKLKEEAKGRKLTHPETDAFLKQKYYWKVKDPTFSVDRNKAVIENTIKKHEKTIEFRRKMYRDLLGERTEAVYDWLKYRQNGGGKGIEKWFGSKMMAYLKAEQVGAIAGKNGSRQLISR